MGKSYLLRENQSKLEIDDVHLFRNPEALKIAGHPVRLRIMRMLQKKNMCSSELAKKLGLSEQKVYYHINLLKAHDLIEIVEEKAIRGTVAKIFAPRSLNFAFALDPAWRPASSLISRVSDKKVEQFFEPIISEGELNAKIVVGSPDPHGVHKARARDGHYAIDLGVYLGKLCSLSTRFSTYLDVDASLEEKSNLVVVGGPVTNLIMASINDFLPAKFSDTRPWGIIGKQVHTDENTGLIAKIPHPYAPECRIIAIAGIRYSGTKAAVIALTRHTDLILHRFTGQKEYYCIVQGYDLDGDGKIDSIEVLE